MSLLFLSLSCLALLGPSGLAWGPSHLLHTSAVTTSNSCHASIQPIATRHFPMIAGQHKRLQVSRARRAKNIKVASDKLTVSSTCGYRSAQSSRGACAGTWYFEMIVTCLGETGHCRIGIGTQKQEMEAPCGYLDASYGFRDVDGSKIHQSLREPYGSNYREGDVIGCVCHVDVRPTCKNSYPYVLTCLTWWLLSQSLSKLMNAHMKVAT
jgi:hypothetical protein